MLQLKILTFQLKEIIIKSMSKIHTHLNMEIES